MKGTARAMGWKINKLCEIEIKNEVTKGYWWWRPPNRSWLNVRRESIWGRSDGVVWLCTSSSENLLGCESRVSGLSEVSVIVVSYGTESDRVGDSENMPLVTLPYRWPLTKIMEFCSLIELQSIPEFISFHLSWSKVTRIFLSGGDKSGLMDIGCLRWWQQERILLTSAVEIKDTKIGGCGLGFVLSYLPKQRQSRIEHKWLEWVSISEMMEDTALKCMMNL